MEFSEEEIYWIERTADIEALACIKNFLNTVHIDRSKLAAGEENMLNDYSRELIDLYRFLKVLRVKLQEARNGSKE